MDEIIISSPFPYPYNGFHEWQRDRCLVTDVREYDIDPEEPTHNCPLKIRLLHAFGYDNLRTGPRGNFRPIEDCGDLQVGTAFHHVYQQACKRLERDEVIMDAVFEGIRQGRTYVVVKEEQPVQLSLF